MRKLFSVVFGFVALTSNGYAQDIKPGKVEFFAVGKPSLLKIHGESSEFSGKWEILKSALTATITVATEKFDTGLSTRNKHLKEKALETSKFPDAVLTLDPITLSEPAAKKNVPFTGKLKLHGVEKPVQGTVDLEPTDKNWASGLKFDAKLVVNSSDFGIARAEFAGMKIEDSVEIKASGEMKK